MLRVLGIYCFFSDETFLGIRPLLWNASPAPTMIGEVGSVEAVITEPTFTKVGDRRFARAAALRRVLKNQPFYGWFFNY